MPNTARDIDPWWFELLRYAIIVVAFGAIILASAHHFL